MNPRSKLIPRNNWDYGFQALWSSFKGAYNSPDSARNVDRIFQQKPIYTNSGRTSLYAILKALELPVSAKIGVPLFCCSVVFNAIQQAGLVPCFLDSELVDCNLSPADLARKSSDLAAVIVVHMFGKPCDMEAIHTAAEGLPVIEDCAQAIFSSYRQKQTGALSEASFFSFRCGKYLSAGEGSAILCREAELHRKIERVVNSFEDWSTAKMLIDSLLTFAKATLYNRPWYGLVGHPVGIRLDKKMNLTAKDGFDTRKIAPSYLAIIDSRIAHFEERIQVQRDHAQTLLAALQPGNFYLPDESPGCSSNWFQFALRFPDNRQRDAMADHLWQSGIDTAKYLDNIAVEAFTNYGYTGDCPNAEQLSKTILLIPISYRLPMSDIEHIAHSINEGAKLI